MILEVFLALSVVWLTWYYITVFYSRRGNAPPGPIPLPFIGNALQLGQHPPFTMDALWRAYGDVYQIQFPVGTFVIVNGYQATKEALVTKRDDFAGRPIDIMYPVDVITQAKSVASADYGVKFMFRKKLLKSAFRVFGESLERVEERVNSAVVELIGVVEKSGGEPLYIKHHISSAITAQLWDWISSQRCRFGDETLNSLIEFQDKMIFLLMQGSLHQMLPFMKYLPTKFNRYLADVLRMREEIFGTELHQHLQTYNSDEPRDIIDNLIASYEAEVGKGTTRDIGSIEDIKYLLLDIVVAGADTSITSVSWFVLYMVLYRDVQKTLQAELDEVVGVDRLPRWSDIKNLHRLQSAVCEVMRITGFLPWMPHRAIRDTTVQGYRIPKGTSVFINYYRTHRDPKEFAAPEEFRPNRFLDADGKFVGWTGVAAFMPFGLGRRACIGQDLGKMQTFSVISSLLHQFSLALPELAPTPSLDEGKLGSLRHPVDYHVIATRRH